MLACAVCDAREGKVAAMGDPDTPQARGDAAIPAGGPCTGRSGLDQRRAPGPTRRLTRTAGKASDPIFAPHPLQPGVLMAKPIESRLTPTPIGPAIGFHSAASEPYPAAMTPRYVKRFAGPQPCARTSATGQPLLQRHNRSGPTARHNVQTGAYVARCCAVPVGAYRRGGGGEGNGQ